MICFSVRFAAYLGCRPTLDSLKAVSKMVGQEAEKAKAAVRVARHKVTVQYSNMLG